MAFNFIPSVEAFKNPIRRQSPPLVPAGTSPFSELMQRIKKIFTPQQAPQVPQVSQTPQIPQTTQVGEMFKNFQTQNIGGFTVPSLFQTPTPPQPQQSQQFNPMRIPQVLPTQVQNTPVSAVKAPPTPFQPSPSETLQKPPILPQTTPQATPTVSQETPNLPNMPPETQKVITDAEKTYQEALKISPEELSTQEDLDRLIESTKKAYQNTLDQPIPLEFITGQMASLERRALGLVEPLERKLSRMQASRTASLEVSKFGLERADKAREALKPIAGTSFYDPKTGKFVSAPEAGKAPSTIETAQGIKQWDPTTKNWIDTGFTKAPSATQEAKALEKEEKEEAKTQQASLALQNINSLISGDRYKAISGVMQTGSVPFLGDRAAVNQYQQLQGILKLGIRQLIKGQGQISDYEGKVLAEAASDLSRLTNESEMLTALKKASGVIRTNQGESVLVRVIDNTGNVIGEGELNGQDIYEAVLEGNKIEYL